MKHLSYFVLILLSAASLSAQIEVPLQGNRLLQRHYAGQEGRAPQEQAVETRNPPRECQLEKPGIIYAPAGTETFILVDIDTTDLGTDPGIISCLNCEDNPLGPAFVQGDSLIVIPDPEIGAAQYTFTAEFCNPVGCRSKDFTVVGRRDGRNHFPPTLTLGPEERILAEAEAARLPGPLACNKFIDAEDEYEGRSQNFYFTTYTRPDSTFYYASSRYGGVDSVYLVLCDTFAVCDTFHYAFQVQSDTVRLSNTGQEAFFDDFSYAALSPRASLWLDPDAYINSSFGLNPPSLGVATMDGVNASGQPYGFGYGPADRLTSTYLDLTGISEDLFLSLWIQPGGLGERPRPQDVLVLEFKTSDGKWQEIQTFEGGAVPPPGERAVPFFFHQELIEPIYKHKAFQFRLTNFNNRNGINNIWNIDYVRLSRFAADSTINDIAFTRPPRPILANYSSMPWRHFEGREEGELRDAIEVQLRNLAPQALNAAPSFVRLEEEATNIDLFSATLFNGQERNIPEGEPITRLYGLESDPAFPPSPWNTYISRMRNDAFDEPERLSFVMEYTLENNSQPSGAGFEGIQRNDTVHTTTVFDNYFAYDDGTAESGLIAQEGDQIAVRFTAGVNDSLRAIRIHFPHMVSDVSNQEFNLKVWVGKLDGDPEFVMNFLKPFYPDNVFDTLQGFTTYPLMDGDGNFRPLALPPGDFFIGWEQLSNCTFTDCIPVGLDKNSPEGRNFNFFNNNFSIWEPFSELAPAGALMIRPVVGSETPGPTGTREEEQNAFALQLFPNPARDVVNLYPEDGLYQHYEVELFNQLGQRVYRGPLQPQLAVGGYQNGLYVLRVLDRRNHKTVSRRLILAR